MGSAGISLLSELLLLDPRKRVNAIDALKHEYFSAHPLPAKPGEIPKFEESHELDRRRRHQRAPAAPAGGTVGVGNHVNNDVPWGNSRGDSRRNGVWDSQRQVGRSYDNRGNSGPPPSSSGPPRIPPGAHGNSEHHRPAWAKNEPQNLPMGRVPPRDLGLPPRPPPARDDRDRDRGGGGPMERSRSARNGANSIDTYIPSYGGPGPRDGPPPRDRDDGRGWDRDRDRDRDYHRERLDRDRDRDWRDRGRDMRDERDYVRKRSRSPLHPPDRDRDRRGDMYRR